MVKSKNSPPAPLFHQATPRIVTYVRGNLLENFSRSTQNFLLHVFESMKYGFRNDPQGAVPIARSYLRKYFRYMVDQKDLRILHERDIIRSTSYDIKESLSKKYWIPQDRLGMMVLFQHADIKDMVALHTTHKKPKKKVRVSAKATKPVQSDLVKQSIKLISMGLLNHEAILDLFNRRIKIIEESLNMDAINRSMQDIRNFAEALLSAALNNKRPSQFT